MTPQKTLDEYMRKEILSKTNQQPTPQYKTIEFYRETEFQETPIGKIPKDWKIAKLKDIGNVVSGFTFPLEFQGKKTGKYPFIKVNDMNNCYKYIHVAENYVDDDDLVKLKAKPYPRNTIIFPKIGMAVRLNKYRILGLEAVFDNNIAGIIVDDKLAYHEFIYYCLQVRVNLMSLAGMTTVPSISKSKLENIPLPLPRINEQVGIAEVLSTVDRAIEGVDESVARLERLKRALMRELLTGRVRVREENGKLVFYRETEFQETEIGKIPREWRLHRLVELFSYVKGKKPKDLVNEKKEGYLPYLTTDYLRTGIPSNYAKPGNNVILVDNNDILLLWDGSNAGEFFLGRKGILASTMVKLQPKVSSVNKLFYYYYLKQTESHLKSHSKGTGIPHVDKSVLENLLLPMPSLEEQWGIAEVLSTVDRAIELHYEKKVRLECLKRGLMDLLLSGRVRVRVESVS